MIRRRFLARRTASLPVLLALLLVGVVAATTLGAPGVPPSSGGIGLSAALQAAASVPGVRGDDACGLLSDAELLTATGARAVVARIPGPGDVLPSGAGCRFELEPAGQASGTTWSVHLGVKAPGGATAYEQTLAVAGGDPGAGLGDRAVRLALLGDWIGLTGDVAVHVHAVLMGGDRVRPQDEAARMLLWRVLSRLDPASAGTPAPTPEPAAPARALAERMRGPAFGQDAVDATVEILARSGIATYSAAGDEEPLMPVTAPGSPMMLLLDQVRAMALEAWAGGGIAGAELDALAPADPELATTSEILAGYVAAVDTEGAQVARALMGEVDWRAPGTAVFPQLVLALMVSDVARERLADAVAMGRAGPQPVRATALALGSGTRTAQGGACSAVQGFIDSALTQVFEALRPGQPSGPVGRVVVTIWGFVLGLAEPAARALIRELTQPVLDRIATVAGTVGLVSLIVSAIRPWTLSVAAEPPITAKGVGGTPGQAGRLVVRVDLGGLDEWPAHIKDCAAAAGRPLPNLKPEGAPVRWSAITQAPAGLVAEGARGSRLDARGMAHLDFQTLIDDVPAPWADRAGRIAVTVTVERPQLEQLRQLAIDQLLGQIPSIARGPLAPWLRPIVDRLSSRLTYLISTQASGIATVVHHVPAPTPAPGVSPEPVTPPRGVMVRVDRAAEPPLLAGTVLELISCEGPYGTWSGVLRAAGIDAGDIRMPFVDLPLQFALPGSGGIRSTTTSTSGFLVASLERLSAPVTMQLTVVVDGRTMGITGYSLDTVLPVGVGANAAGQGTLLENLPIVPAPPGTCP